MNRNFIFKLVSYLLILMAPVLWLLKILLPTTFAWFNLSLAVGFVTAGIAFMVLLRAFITTKGVTFKKLEIFIAGALGIIAVFSFVSAFALPKNLIAPIVCIVVAACLLLSLLATGGKNWDQADNHNVGYKNYHQRKAEQEQQEKQAENDNNV